jgi:uncharacterized membrane protein
MEIARILRHLATSHSGTGRRFPVAVMDSIEAAIGTAEARSSGEIRFVVESSLELSELWAGTTPRDRALQTFSDLHLWNTELRNAVLIYVLMADRDVEVVADRGAAAVIPAGDWEGVCRLMEAHFRERRFQAGALAGVEAVGRLLERHFAAPAHNRDELPNQPALL